MQYLTVARQYAHDHPTVLIGVAALIVAAYQFASGNHDGAQTSFAMASSILGLRTLIWTNPNPPVKQA